MLLSQNAFGLVSQNQLRTLRDPAPPPAAATAASYCSLNRILVIDDEIRPDDSLVSLLRIEGLEVECVSSGRDGLEKASSPYLQLILLDLHLPDVLGLTVLSELRRRGSTVPVLVVTGWYMGTDHEQLCQALGTVGFVRKPLDASHLTELIRSVISTTHANSSTELVTTHATRYATFPEIGHHPTKRPPLDPPTTKRVQPPSQWNPEQQTLCGLHRRALNGDAEAIDELTALLLVDVQRRLRRRFASYPDDWRWDAIVDALLEYRARPIRYDPSRGVPLNVYIVHASICNLLNRLDHERRRTVREADYILNAAECSVQDDRQPTIQGELSVMLQLLRPSTFSQSERRVLQLWLAGERNSEVYARAIGLNSAATSCQRATVRRIKERVLQRLRRLGRKSHRRAT